MATNTPQRYVLVRGRNLGFAVVPTHVDTSHKAAETVAHMLGYKLTVQPTDCEPRLPWTEHFVTVPDYDDDYTVELWVLDHKCPQIMAAEYLGGMIKQTLGGN